MREQDISRRVLAQMTAVSRTEDESDWRIRRLRHLVEKAGYGIDAAVAKVDREASDRPWRRN